MKFFVAVFLALQAVHCILPAQQSERCSSLMNRHGLTERFPGAVSHGVHSITLEDIRYFFKPNATENNRVPTLNYDLTSPQPVLRYAPLNGFDTSFKTIGMQHVDQMMRNMDKKDYYLTNYNTLEQLVHTAHMTEVWTDAKGHYERISGQRVPGELCDCVTDIDRNGIMKMLPFMSLKIRYPGLTAGKRMRLPNGDLVDWSGDLYTYSFFNDWSRELSTFDFNQPLEKILKQATNRLVDHDKGISHLTSERQWFDWKQRMKKMVAHDNYELAMFLYCSLKE